METVMARYDGTLRTSGGNIAQILYGEDGIDAVRQCFESLTLNKNEFEELYVMNVNDTDFGFDAQSLSFLESDIIEDCRNDPEVQLLLDRGADSLREDQSVYELLWRIVRREGKVTHLVMLHVM